MAKTSARPVKGRAPRQARNVVKRPAKTVAKRTAAKKAAKPAAKKKPTTPPPKKAASSSGAMIRHSGGKNLPAVSGKAATRVVAAQVTLVPEAKKIVDMMREKGVKLATAQLSFCYESAAAMLELRNVYGEEANKHFQSIAVTLGYAEVSTRTMNAWANTAEAFTREEVRDYIERAKEQSMRLTWTHFVDASVLTAAVRGQHMLKVISEGLSTTQATHLMLTYAKGKKNKAKGGKAKAHKVPTDPVAMLMKARGIAVNFVNYAGDMQQQLETLQVEAFDKTASQTQLVDVVASLEQAASRIAAILKKIVPMQQAQGGAPIDVDFSVVPASDAEPEAAEEEVDAAAEAVAAADAAEEAAATAGDEFDEFAVEVDALTVPKISPSVPPVPGAGASKKGAQPQPKPTTVAQQPKPVAQQPKPVAQQPKPVAQQPKPTTAAPTLVSTKPTVATVGEAELISQSFDDEFGDEFESTEDGVALASELSPEQPFDEFADDEDEFADTTT